MSVVPATDGEDLEDHEDLSSRVVRCNQAEQMWLPEVEGLAFVSVLARSHSVLHFSFRVL